MPTSPHVKRDSLIDSLDSCKLDVETALPGGKQIETTPRACSIPSINYPYDPSSWLERARIFEVLGYPELVVGDCWKAAYLCQRLITSPMFSQGHRLGHRCGFWMLDHACEDSARDAVWFNIKERMRDVEAQAVSLQNRYLTSVRGVSGPYRRRGYPWLEDCYKSRDEIVLQQINEDLQRPCLDNATGKQYCIAASNALDVPGLDDVLGVFARTAIAAGQDILVDESEIWGCKVNRALSTLIEAGDSATVAWLGLPLDEAKYILSLFQSQDIDDSARTLLKIRCLRQILHDHVAHPLDHPVMARLKPTYHRDDDDDFHLMDDIAIPNKTLLMLGVDIFANVDFDTWMLFTIEARIDNNCFMSSTSACLASLFALFNHSCAPNVLWDCSKSHKSVHMRAARDIKQGEQLFVSYNEYAMEKPVLERQKDLSRWIDGPCKCPRCLDEMTALQTTGSEQSKTIPAWNAFAKATFPEDLMSSGVK